MELPWISRGTTEVVYRFSCADRELVAEGESVQVFLDMNRELVLTMPPFFEAWKKKWGLR